MSTNLSDVEKINKFFRDPKPGEGFENNEVYTGESSLFILRRDAKICLSENGSCHEQAIWPAAMTIFAGIDLLGQCYGIGNNKNDKFTSFCMEFLESNDGDKVNQDQANALYNLRCAFMHNYSLYNQSLSGKTKYEFIVTYKEPGAKLIYAIPDISENIYKIDLFVLYERFDQSISDYHNRLLQNKNGEQNNFLKVYKVYGLIGPINQPSESKAAVNMYPAIDGSTLSTTGTCISGSVIIRV